MAERLVGELRVLIELLDEIGNDYRVQIVGPDNTVWLEDDKYGLNDNDAYPPDSPLAFDEIASFAVSYETGKHGRGLGKARLTKLAEAALMDPGDAGYHEDFRYRAERPKGWKKADDAKPVKWVITIPKEAQELLDEWETSPDHPDTAEEFWRRIRIPWSGGYGADADQEILANSNDRVFEGGLHEGEYEQDGSTVDVLVFRVGDDGVTDTARHVKEMLDAYENYPVLDQDDFSDRQWEAASAATFENIERFGRSMTSDAAPRNWAARVYEWLAANDEEKVQWDTADGADPEREDIAKALNAMDPTWLDFDARLEYGYIETPDRDFVCPECGEGVPVDLFDPGERADFAPGVIGLEEVSERGGKKLVVWHRGQRSRAPFEPGLADALYQSHIYPEEVWIVPPKVKEQPELPLTPEAIAELRQAKFDALSPSEKRFALLELGEMTTPRDPDYEDYVGAVNRFKGLELSDEQPVKLPRKSPIPGHTIQLEEPEPAFPQLDLDDRPPPGLGQLEDDSAAVRRFQGIETNPKRRRRRR